MQLKMCERLLSDEESIYVIWSIFWPQMLLFPHHPWEPRIIFIDDPPLSFLPFFPTRAGSHIVSWGP